jgi:hypothetical protein
MNNKSQANMLSWILILIVIAVTIFFGFKAVKTTSEKGCVAQLALLEKNLELDIESMYGLEGSVIEKKYSIPCGIERIYFVDNSREVPFSVLSDYPEIMDSLKSDTGKNIFLIRDGTVHSSISGGDLTIDTPYFDCYTTSTGKLDIFLEGKEGETEILKKNSKFDCTFTGALPVELDPEDTSDLLDEIDTSEPEIDVCTIERNMVEADGDITVTILKKGDPCRYYEQIPKCAISSLEEAIDNGEIDIQNMKIHDGDPILMWDFAAGEDEEFYRLLNSIIDEGCKRGFKGVSVNGVDPAAAPNVIADVGTKLNDLHTKITNHPTLSDGKKRVANHNLDNIEEFLKRDKERQVSKFLDRLDDVLDGSSISIVDLRTQINTDYGYSV